MVVHYGGYVQPMQEINAVGKKYGIKIIEDCAHALDQYMRCYLRHQHRL